MSEGPKNIIFNCSILLNCLLLVIAFFGDTMQLPAVLQVTGRMHPLLLHFPIVLLLLAFIAELFLSKNENPQLKEISNWLLLSAAFTSVLSALAGIFLSKESDYNQSAIAWHKWMGTGIAFLSLLWYALREKIRSVRFANLFVGILSAAAIITTGHMGANITHGEDFLVAPLKSKAPAPVFENGTAYTHLIQPIIEARCMSCHNSTKAKGDLVMETEALLLKGGKSGKLWDTSAADFGLLMQRIHMPNDKEEHMPPISKSQLTEEEKKAIFYWIKSGASFTKKIIDYQETDSIRILGESKFKNSAGETYAFEAADAATVKMLNSDYRVVQAIDNNSPALYASFFGAGFFKSEQLKELDKIKENIVQLSLNKMPVKDDDLKQVASFSNLRKLNLSFTQITGAGLQQLKQLKELRQLSVSGNSIAAKDLETLKEFPKLNTMYIWNTGITQQDIATLKTKFPKINFQTGFNGDTVRAQLNTPVIDCDVVIFPTSTQVIIKGLIKNAVARYTTDGTEPDSLTSAIYKDNIVMSKTAMLKVKTFLPGWISSAVAEKNFYKTGLKIDSIELETQPNPQYAVGGSKTLTDVVKADLNFRKNWLGYKENDLKAFIHFKSPTRLSTISLSTLVDIGSYIMPAAQIEIWGGNDKASLKLLKKIHPAQPESAAQPTMVMQKITFNPIDVKLIKIIAKPTILPKWHIGKGEKAWIFFDELFVE